MKRPIKITHLAVFAMSDDGKIRKVKLGGQQPKQVHRLLRQICGGTIHLVDTPVTIDAERQRPSLMERWRAFLAWLHVPRLTKAAPRESRAKQEREIQPQPAEANL
jgi:hypothetical protein